MKYLGDIVEEDISWGLIQGALSSVAQTTIIPMQDILKLGNSARMNIPATQVWWQIDNNSFLPFLASNFPQNVILKIWNKKILYTCILVYKSVYPWITEGLYINRNWCCITLSSNLTPQVKKIYENRNKKNRKHELKVFTCYLLISFHFSCAVWKLELESTAVEELW